MFLKDWCVVSGVDGEPVSVHEFSTEDVGASVEDIPIIVVSSDDVYWRFLL